VHLHLLSSDSFSFLIFFLLPLSSLSLPTSAFPSVHIVGSLASKLPSVTSNVGHPLLGWFIDIYSAISDDFGNGLWHWMYHTIQASMPSAPPAPA
jgi:hypothetical protein